ncbi:Tll0287-like domain-containing protein [Thermoflexibacter ruber]|uniref:Tll0287-like domain-containing protein n=1 Tax=Thermoflexibacter ruber TaxID=1003 RepID=A0A1I2J8M6_9BACT|nr:DUF3365 domain-containing protein [Thermoflexibacter ruber]SFF50408.1 Protein of unknown function [Thermoflexibacter ruber]
MKTVFLVFGLLFLLSACQSDSSHQSKKVAEPNPTNTVFDGKIYVEQGNQLVKLTFDTLSASLKNAIQKEGIGGALKFCNVNAHALTNMYADRDEAIIKRASTKNRNPTNAADSLETMILAQYEQEKNGGVELLPKVVTKGEIVHYFKPILVQALCLNCHGEVGKEIDEKNYQVIKTLYPEDKAVGYQLNDLRGVWHIQWKRNQQN